MSSIPPRALALATALVFPAALLTVAAGTSGAAAPADDAGSFTATPLTPADRVEGFKAASSALAQSSPGLLDRTDSTLVPVMIKLDHDAMASYRGGVGDLAATSPSVTGKKVNPKSKAGRAYDAYLAENEQELVDALAAVAPRASVGNSFRIVYGGVSALVPANRVQDILAIDGVVAVQADKMNQPDTDASAAFLNAGDVYAKLGGVPNAGKGVIFGDLDTGVWPEHPSFADQGNLSAPPAKADGTPRACNFGDNPLTPATDVFVCNNKLIGGQPFLDTYLSDPGRAADELFHTARDSNGHGTHTTSTAAGNALASAPVLGVERGPVAGMAPGAWVIEYKVCGVVGCFPSDSTAAVGQAILDGVKVINFSISGGTQPFSDPVELAFLDAYAAGVFVATSAGNDGPGAGTVNHLSPWVTSTAASTQTREFATTLNVAGDNGDTFAVDGASITQGVSTPTPIVMAGDAPYNNTTCTTPAAPGTFTGKIVACQRTPGRVLKGFNVLQGGAVGMVLYNPTLADVETDSHWLPTVHVPDGTQFVAFMNAHNGETASFATGQKRNGQGDVMAAFSSRGPGGLFIKPDVAAPGVQILAGHTPIPDNVAGGPPGNLFQAIAGTSMASPHAAGAALLMMASHDDDWTPGQVKSALMTTAIDQVLKENLVTPADPFDMGAGRIDIGKADLAPLSFDETAANFFLKGNDPLHAIHLNIASINAPVLPGRIVTTRTAVNTTGARATFDAMTKAPAGSSITVTPNRFTLNAGAAETLTITIRTSAPVGAQQFGEIRLKQANAGAQARLPVAWIRAQGSVSLDQTCAAASIPVNGQTTCTVTATNESPVTQTVDLETTTSSHLDVVSASGATKVDDHTVQKSVSLAGFAPGVPSIAPGELFGYIPLAGFGVTPVPVGDEDIVNFSVPPFMYNGISYSVVGVDSNGYLVVGGGTAEDNNCCNLTQIPDPARPNNILAPFWTDLDGTGAPGIYAATLTDGVNTWLVVEHQVNVFGTSSNRHFQVWIGVDGVQDITFAYDPGALPADPAGQDFLVGAENSLGTGGGQLPTGVLPTQDLRVTSTAPTPGASVSYTVTLRGAAKGTGLVTTEMAATGVPGITIEEDTITVTKK